MARKKSWFDYVRTHSNLIGLVALVIIAGLFRLACLATLPPGLSSGEASIGLSALHLLHHGFGQLWTAGGGYAPVWVMLEALSIALFGHTALALRLWPAIVGVAAVGAVWWWARDWFGARTAWIAAFLVAVTPWAVTLSRSASPAILATLLGPLTLLASGRAYARSSHRWLWLTSGLLVIDLLSGPWGWFIALGVIIVALNQRRRLLQRLTPRTALGPIALGLAGIVVVVILAVVSHGALRSVSAAAGLTSHLDQLVRTLGKVAAMFNLHGDDNFLHNFGGQPLLNAFVGLMFIAGLLVSLSRLGRRNHTSLFIVFVITLIPAVLSPTTAPNAARAAAALPFTLTLAAIGTGYLLDLWYTTFPINSAARSTGLSAIIVLLALSGYQGAVQVFRAWYGSAETYQAYNEAAVQAAHYLRTTKPVADTYFVANADEQTVVSYLNYNPAYPLIAAPGIATLPVASGSKRFVITASERDAAAAQLALKYPGGKLVPHYSTFSENELYYDYELAQ